MLAALLDASLNGDKAKVLELLHHVDINASDSVRVLTSLLFQINHRTEWEDCHSLCGRERAPGHCQRAVRAGGERQPGNQLRENAHARCSNTGAQRHGGAAVQQGKTALELATSVGYVAIIELLKPHMFVFPAMLVFRQAQEVRRLGVNSALRRFPRELCRMVMHMLC
ncbi:hypothetical protein BASA81_006687 [Batrachochytrium salamandrivorans]|nr:hypothetical protein BASA81_006687 [Batrachochytrium salamandrivorans]